ncbi:MAG: hypothetical protein JWP45_927 [Mucilaginibacter sp.]|nr:hypothetical protein [Mucilaginibacter sp.]
MAKEEEKKPKVKRQVRAEKYAEKVTFDGTLEDMIKIAIKPIHGKKK